MKENERIAYCGLFCPMCSFVTAHETGDKKHLLAMPARYDHLKEQSFDECFCEGCRVQTDHCHCEMKPCAENKGLLTCADCDGFPCEHISAFGNDGAPHHEDALRNLHRIKEVGYDVWLGEMEALMHCACGERQSWYHRCANCNDGGRT